MAKQTGKLPIFLAAGAQAQLSVSINLRGAPMTSHWHLWDGRKFEILYLVNYFSLINIISNVFSHFIQTYMT